MMPRSMPVAIRFEREQRGDAEIGVQPVHDDDALTFSLAARRSVWLMRVCQPGPVARKYSRMRIDPQFERDLGIGGWRPAGAHQLVAVIDVGALEKFFGQRRGLVGIDVLLVLGAHDLFHRRRSSTPINPAIAVACNRALRVSTYEPLMIGPRPLSFCQIRRGGRDRTCWDLLFP